ncbi:unnamed protein product [Rhizophagus irregularis]|uniref:Uncharacterized protein n=1 Tax=Rhizophagus irregularis TaxID=588596 RepID=A0A915ZHB1_9GLOM|nr:unnamed protein product [Rhizophagus irregularis]
MLQKKNQWKRDGKTTVALKTLNNSQNITLEFINQVMLHLKIQEYKLSDQIIKYVNPLDRPNANDLLNFFDKWLKELNRYIKGIENQAEATKTELIKQIEEIEKVKNINENPSPDNISDKDYSDNSSNDSEDNDFEECAIHD